MIIMQGAEVPRNKKKINKSLREKTDNLGDDPTDMSAKTVCVYLHKSQLINNANVGGRVELLSACEQTS